MARLRASLVSVAAELLYSTTGFQSGKCRRPKRSISETTRSSIWCLARGRCPIGDGAASSTSRWHRLYFFPLPPRTRIVATDVGHARFLYRGAGCSDKRTHLLASRQPLKACHLHLAQLY